MSAWTNRSGAPPAGRDRAVVITVAPPRTRRFTMASPMPLVPPVTRIRPPLKSPTSLVCGSFCMSTSSSRRTRFTADSAESLVRVDQIFPARGLFAIDGDLLYPQRLGERYFLRVDARERGLDLGRDPLSQLLGGLEANLLEEGGEQPAANTPSHAEGAVELGRPTIQSAVDVYLLVRCGPITAVFLRRLVRGNLHSGEYLPRQSSTADRIESHRGTGGDERRGQVVHEGWRVRVAHVGGTDLLEDVHVLGLAHDVHQANAVLDADLVEHLPEIGGGRRVHEGLVTLRAHGFDHTERGERIDEAGGALGRCGTRWQHQALHGLDAAVLRVHGATEDGDGLPHQRLRCRRCPRLDDHPGPFVADRQRLLQTPGHRLHHRR